MTLDLMEVLWEEAFRIKVVSSEGVRSAIERKFRAVKGDVRGVEEQSWNMSVVKLW